jgi:hypothetical protein
VVESAEAPPPKQRAAEKPPTGLAKLALDAIVAATNLHGRHPEVLDWRHSAKGVTLDQARTEFARVAGHIDAKHRASRFAGAVTSLKNAGRVLGTAEWIWLPASTAANSDTGQLAPNHRASKEALGAFGAAPNSPDAPIGTEIGDSVIEVGKSNGAER